MYRRHGDKLAVVFLAVDLAATAVAWIAAYFLRFAFWTSPFGVPDVSLVFRAVPVVLIVAAVAYRLVGLYEIHRLQQLPRELGQVFKASGLMFLLAITVAFYRRDDYESRLALALFLGINAVSLAVVRRLLWRALKHFRGKGLNHGRAVIVGAGRTGRLVARTIQGNRWTGLEAVGFVDRPAAQPSALLPNLGKPDQLAHVVRTHDIDHVFIALPLSRYGELPEVYRSLSELLVEVQLVPDLPQLAGMRVRTVDIDDVSFLSLRASPNHGWWRWFKRGMDLVVGTGALVALSPLMAALAVLVKLTSTGPVLYRQRRVGLGGRPFDMLKFRSMRAGAENLTGPVWAAREDDRCTPLGRVMRKWSLDELPQLFNVLAGDMSLVGPRPERCHFIDKFRHEIPNYHQRHQVKAGITGWAQVNGWRGNTSLRRRVECDLYYIAHWSPWLDLKILWMTLWRGFRHRNAY
jgi:Undecaprenyl-phosphate glucose phosphotransferase